MISKPDVNISLSPSTSLVEVGAHKDLIICQTPNATANALVTGIDDYTQTELNALLGAGSYARVMVQRWLDANKIGNNIGASLDMIVLQEGAASTAATITLAFSGTATADGTISLSILSSKLYNKSVSITTGDTATVAGAAVTTAYASTTAPFTVADATGTVTITATDTGTIGNDYGVEITGIPAGLSVVITGATGGTVAPTVTDVMDLVGTTRYQGVLWPSDLKASLDEITDFLDNRFNVSNDILDGVAFMGEVDTLANLKTTVNAVNSASLVVMGNNIVSSSTSKDGPEIVHPADWTAAEFMAIRARRLTEDASISSVVTTVASTDQFGGKHTASLPYFNTPLDDTPITTSVNLFTSAEQAELNTAGYTVYGPNKPVTDSIMGTVVTTYKTDAAGNANNSFKYLNYVDTASKCREFIFVNFKSIFAQSRLTDGDLVGGLAMENAASIKAVYKRLLEELKDDALIRRGSVSDQLVEDNTTVVLDLENRKATINSVLPIVTQLETINMPLRLTFEL